MTSADSTLRLRGHSTSLPARFPHNHASKAALFTGKQSGRVFADAWIRPFARIEISRLGTVGKTSESRFIVNAIQNPHNRGPSARKLRPFHHPRSLFLSPPPPLPPSPFVASVEQRNERREKARFGSVELCFVRRLLLDAAKELEQWHEME